MTADERFTHCALAAANDRSRPKPPDLHMREWLLVCALLRIAERKTVAGRHAKQAVEMWQESM